MFMLDYALLQILLGFWKVTSRVPDVLLEALSPPFLGILSAEWSGPFIIITSSTEAKQSLLIIAVI